MTHPNATIALTFVLFMNIGSLFSTDTRRFITDRIAACRLLAQHTRILSLPPPPPADVELLHITMLAPLTTTP